MGQHLAQTVVGALLGTDRVDTFAFRVHPHERVPPVIDRTMALASV